MDSFIIGIIVVAYAFDFFNGFHDAANSITTVIATRVLSPFAAVSLAAIFNFIAFLIFGVAVAKTIGSGIVTPSIIDQNVILGALVGAISWDVITWYVGLPTSSSHALIGGLVGAGVAKAGFSVIVFGKLDPVLLFMVISPLLGMAGAFGIMVAVINLLHKKSAQRVNGYFRRLQLVSSSLVSLSHGTNDAQKTMGIVTALLVATGEIKVFAVPLWVVLAAHSAIALGTFAGGWRIVRTMGFRMTKLDPVHGFSAETAAAAVIMGSSLLGIPVSTTHCVSGSIMGSGATQRLSAVRWGVARRIIWAWVITIPAAAIIAGLSYILLIGSL